MVGIGTVLFACRSLSRKEGLSTGAGTQQARPLHSLHRAVFLMQHHLHPGCQRPLPCASFMTNAPQSPQMKEHLGVWAMWGLCPVQHSTSHNRNSHIHDQHLSGLGGSVSPQFLASVLKQKVAVSDRPGDLWLRCYQHWRHCFGGQGVLARRRS